MFFDTSIAAMSIVVEKANKLHVDISKICSVKSPVIIGPVADKDLDFVLSKVYMDVKTTSKTFDQYTNDKTLRYQNKNANS